MISTRVDINVDSSFILFRGCLNSNIIINISMSTFTSNLQIEQLDLTENVKVLKDFAYYSLKFKIIVIIRKGFITDLDSIPLILKSFVRASPKKTWRCYTLHDVLYRNNFNLKISDLILDEALDLVGIDSYARGKVYYGLRMFGSATTDQKLIENAMQYTEIIDVEDWTDLDIVDIKNYTNFLLADN